MDYEKELNKLNDQKDILITKLSSFRYLRPGSLVERYRKCGKPYCHCANDGSPGHGPSYSLTRTLNGKTVTKIIPKSEVPQTIKQIAEYKSFKETIDELIETHIKICDTLLEIKSSPAVTLIKPVTEKGGFKSPFPKQP